MLEIDFEDIPFVFDESTGNDPVEEEVAVIAAALALMFPHDNERLWARAMRLDAVSGRYGT